MVWLYVKRGTITTYLDKFSIDGIGMPPMLHHTVRSPFQHGDTYAISVLEPRVLNLTLDMSGCDPTDMSRKYTELDTVLNPEFIGDTDLTLGIHEDGVGTYELQNVIYDELVRVDNYRLSPLSNRLAYRFIAYGPVWLAEERAEIVGLEETIYTTEELSFEAEFPIEFDNNTIISETITPNIIPAGNWYSYPTVTMVGPMLNPGIVNDTVGGEVRLVYTVDTGETVTLVTFPGKMSLTSDVAGDLTPYMTERSRISSLYFLPGSIAPLGNEVSVAAHNCVAGTSQFTITYRDAYIGI